MTIKQANDIFKMKHPGGEIIQRGCMGGVSKSSTSVIYNKGGKVYSYNVSNYVELLNRIGFKVLYKREVEAMKTSIEKMQKVIDNNGEENIFFGFMELTPERKQELLNTIAEYQNDIKECIIVNG